MGASRASCAEVAPTRPFPHQLQISKAVHLLQSGTDLAVIALWLGHSSPAVTHQYLEADLATKEATPARLGDPSLG
jgi:site-specific recombinase XerD